MTKYKYITKTFRRNGKQYKVYGKTEKEAEKKLIALRIRLETEEVKKSTVTVEKWLETALEAYKPNVSADYLYQMQGRINKHIIPVIGSERVQAVTPLQCQQIMNKQAGRSSSHISKLRQELFFIFDTARKNGIIKANPAADIVPPTGSRGTRRSITVSERQHFLAVSEGEPQYMIFRLMLFCGLRSSEAMRLTYEDITVLDGVKFFHVRGTKTAAADRLVPIPPELGLGNGSGIVARDPEGKPYTKSSYRCATDRLRRDINLSMGAEMDSHRHFITPLPLAEDFVPYMLRHTYCTDLKKRGVDIRLAKSLMGHSDIKVTADIYDHADEESALLAAEQMGIRKRKRDKTKIKRK